MHWFGSCVFLIVTRLFSFKFSPLSNIEHNELTGIIPSEIGNMKSLNYLALSELSCIGLVLVVPFRNI